jgi:sugar phosphate isomerase/epimerase
MTLLSRRKFLLQSGALGAAALGSQGLSQAARSNPLHLPVGIQLYAVKDALKDDAAGTLKALKKIGFGEVETAGFGDRSAKEFRQLLDDAGLACPSSHLPFDIDNLGPTFEAAHALGNTYAASGGLRASLRPPLTTPDSGMTLEEAKRTADLANRIGAAAQKAGLQYAYHNHNVEFVDQGGRIGYDILLKETDPALVKFEIDCGWMVLGGRNPIDYFKQYPDRFPMIHVKDFLPSRNNLANDGHTQGHAGAELGHGMIDYGPIFTGAKKAGLKHYFVEQEGPFERMSQLDAARQAYAYLHRMS